MIITADELKAFTGRYPDAGDPLPASYAQAACEAVKKFLGYDPEEHELSAVASGGGGEILRLPARHITEVLSISEEGTELEAALFRPLDEDSQYIVAKDGTLFRAAARYEVTFRAGWQEVPEIIKTAAKQVGTLLWESADGNLAVSSTSFADTGSRVFQNFFSQDRILSQISGYRLLEVC